MSDSLAIAGVTATVAEFLRAALLEHNGGTVPGATVTHLAPGNPSLDGGTPTVNVYLLSAAINAMLRNQALPNRDASGALLNRPQLPYDLSYLISFHGDESTLQPQRLMGTVTMALNASPVLGRQLIDYTVRNTAWLEGCDLAQSAESMILTPSAFSDPDELGRFWMNFAGAQHHLAVLYEASVVVLESPGLVEPAVPVGEIDLDVARMGGRGVIQDAPYHATFAVEGRRVTATVREPVDRRARCVLYLNAADPPQRRWFTLEALPRRDGVAGLSFDVSQLPAGSYLARVVIDGGWSSLVREGDQYTGPLITLTGGPHDA